MEPATLTTRRLLLRAPAAADAEQVRAACQDPEIRRWTTVPAPYTFEHAVEFTTRVSPAGWREASLYTFAAVLRAAPTRPLAAMIALTPRGQGCAEIGYWGAPAHRGHGYVTEAVRAVAHWSFAEAAVARLEWRAEVGNDASLAVATRAGFTLEGTLRSALLIHTTRRDAWLASLLPTDPAPPPRTPQNNPPPSPPST